MRHAELQRGHRPKNSNCNTWRLTYPGGSGVSLASIRQRATRLTSAPFRAQARRAWYAASYTGAAVSGGSGHVHHAFLLPFSRRHLLPEPSCSRHGIPRCCLPAGGRSCRTMTGFSTFRTSESRPVPGASSAPGPWCSPGWRADASQHCRIPAAGPKPQKPFHRQGSALRGFTQRFTLFTLPDFPSPVASGWITSSWASSRSFTPHSADSP